MGGIDMEICCPNDKILAVRRFESCHAAGLKDPVRLSSKIKEYSEWQMLNDVKARNSTQASLGKALEVVDHIRINDVEMPLAALRNHGRIDVHAAARERLLLQQFEPFATSATQIENGPAIDTCARRRNEGKIEGKALLDFVSRSTKPIFETNIEGIQPMV